MKKIEVKPVSDQIDETPSIDDELKELTGEQQAETQEEQQNCSEVASDAEETAPVIAEEQKQAEPEVKVEDKVGTKETVEAAKVHIVKYIGGGAWIDKLGKSWMAKSSNPNVLTSQKFTDEEYALRDDIHFMVRYGAMDHTEV